MLVGINGAIGSGKSTATEYLLSKFGFIEYSFAKPLKDIALILGFEPHQAFGTQEDKLSINEFWGISCRQFLQVFGTEICRDCLPKVLPNMKLKDSTLWVRLFEKFYNCNRQFSIAVSDVRFEDESNSIKNLFGYVIRIDRQQLKPASSIPASSIPASSIPASSVPATSDHLIHKSELQTNFIKPHFIIRNNGTIPELHAKLDFVIKRIEELTSMSITSRDISETTEL